MPQPLAVILARVTKPALISVFSDLDSEVVVLVALVRDARC